MPQHVDFSRPTIRQRDADQHQHPQPPALTNPGQHRRALACPWPLPRPGLQTTMTTRPVPAHPRPDRRTAACGAPSSPRRPRHLTGSKGGCALFLSTHPCTIRSVAAACHRQQGQGGGGIGAAAVRAGRGLARRGRHLTRMLLFIMTCSGTGPWLRLAAGAQPGVAAVRGFMGCSVRGGSRRGPFWSSRQPMT